MPEDTENLKLQNARILPLLTNSMLKKTFNELHKSNLQCNSTKTPWVRFQSESWTTQQLINFYYDNDPVQLENFKFVKEEEDDPSFLERVTEMFQSDTPNPTDLEIWLPKFIQMQPTNSDVMYLFERFEEQLSMFFDADTKTDFVVLIDADNNPRRPFIRGPDMKLYLFVKGRKMSLQAGRGDAFQVDAGLYLMHLDKIEQNESMKLQFEAIKVYDKAKQMLEYEQVLTILEKLQQEECVEVLGVSKLISYNLNKEPVEWKNLEMFSSLIGGFKKEENENADSLSARMIARIKKVAAERSVSET